MFLKAILFFLLLVPSVFGQTSFKKGTFLQDDEITEAINNFVTPMFKAADVKGKPTIYMIVEKDVNAAATLNGTLVLFTGFITYCKNADEFVGVIAHEVTHIKAAHPVLGEIKAQQATVPGFLTMALGGILAIASGHPEVLMAGVSSGMSVMQRGMLKYSREQEYAADAGGLAILEKLKWPTKGLESFLVNLNKKYKSDGADPYIQTHPLTAERINQVGQFIKQHSHDYKLPADLEDGFKRMKGKITGFVEDPKKVLKTYATSDKSVEARYARLIAYYRLQKSDVFLKEADALLKDYPDDSYFLEIKGQFCFEHGNKDEAIKCFEKARSKRKNTEGLDLLYAHALIESGKDIQKAIDMVTPHVQKNSDNIWGWHLLGTAYGKLNKVADASGCLAEEASLKGDLDLALNHATRGLNATNQSIKDRSKSLLEEIKIKKRREEK